MDRIKTPYDTYRTSILWKTIEQELNKLEDNQDIKITTYPDYVIGSLVKSIEDTMKSK